GFLSEFVAAKKVARSQYEFKKLRALPNFFRHFSLYVKNGILVPENEDDYNGQNSNFNMLVNDRTGQAQTGGAIIVQNALTNPMLPSQLPKVHDKKEENPFYGKLAYIYLGGADGKNKA